MLQGAAVPSNVSSGPKPEGYPPGAVGVDAETEALNRFPSVLSTMAQIPKHQLGWRMAVLPFRAVGETSSYGIAFGMSEEISAAVSRFRSPRLIAPATFWDGTGPAADVLARCRMYELDYMMDGTIEVIGSQVRVIVVLLDVVLDFEVIWTGHFDGSIDDLFSLQHMIAAETVEQLDPDLFRRGPVSNSPIETSVPTAHRLVLSAIQGIYRVDQARFVRARTSLTEAIVLDSGYAAAYAWLAYWSIMAVGQGWVEDPREITVLAGASADRAVLLDPTDARAICVAGHVKSYLLHDVQSALKMHALAIELNPNLPIAWTLSSCSKMYNGEHVTAIKHATVSQSLSPRDPHIFFTEHVLTLAHFLRGDLAEAETLSEVVLTRNPGHASAINVHLGILGHLGRKEEAVGWLADLQAINPNVSVQSIIARAPWRDKDRDFYVEGLRLAGVPDH